MCELFTHRERTGTAPIPKFLRGPPGRDSPAAVASSSPPAVVSRRLPGPAQLAFPHVFFWLSLHLP